MSMWKEVSFVTASKSRSRILKELDNKIRTPTQLSRELKMPLSTVSLSLKQLLEDDLINCLTPTRRKAKLYKISEIGKKVLSEVEKLQE